MYHENRTRKPHTKSRKGCGNCKLRRVKCDETKPSCKRCAIFGVDCNYVEASDELKIPGEASIVFSVVPNSTPPKIPTDSLSPDRQDGTIERMLNMPLPLHQQNEAYRLTREDIEILRLFKNRTVYTIGTANSVETYRMEMVNLCFVAPYLTHAVLTLTLMHSTQIAARDKYSYDPSEKELFHYYHATALLNDRLSKPIEEKDKDALWGCAALLGACTIASIDAKTSEDAWPLKPNDLGDLDWLRMSDGKKEVWRLVDPMREGSLWKEVLDSRNQEDPMPYNCRVPELEVLAPFLNNTYNFDPFEENHEGEKSPYHTAASILVRLMELECNHVNIMYFLSFLGHMDPRFRQLLHEKDPKALLLLAWWYGKMCQYGVWWQKRRMKLEGQAICMYLERYHADREDLIKLLDFPKMMTGLAWYGTS